MHAFVLLRPILMIVLVANQIRQAQCLLPVYWHCWSAGALPLARGVRLRLIEDVSRIFIFQAQKSGDAGPWCKLAWRDGGASRGASHNARGSVAVDAQL